MNHVIFYDAHFHIHIHILHRRLLFDFQALHNQPSSQAFLLSNITLILAFRTMQGPALFWEILVS